MEDHDLLRQFVQNRDQTAFAELVRRHIDMVYSAARRQMNDSSAAEDVTQDVFVLLVAQAATIRNGNALPGWLFMATRGLALNSLRSISRRRRHEQEAAAMKNEAIDDSSANWERVKPLLDEAVSQLKPDDRDALTIRYFGNRSNEQVAAALGITPQAAQKRISRAVERLREFFSRRGITTSSGALSAVLASHVVSSAPAALSAKVASSALASVKTIASVQTAKGAAAIMAMTNAKLAVTVTVAVIVLAGVAAPVVYLSRSSRVESSGQVGRATTAPSALPWEARFVDAYALKPGQNVKLIKRPFIPERDGFFESMRSDMMPEAPNTYVIQWDGQNLRWTAALTHIERNLASVLYEVGGIKPQDTDIPRDMLSREIPGDWVVRAGATTEQKLADLCPDALGPGKTLKLEPTERDVIVVSGQLNYQPRPNVLKGDVMPQTMQIFLYRGNGEATNHFVAQTQTNMLERLGEAIGRPMVIEAQLGKPRPVMFHSLASLDEYIRVADSSDPATADELLKLVSEQTSLTFTRQRRTVPTWRLKDR